MDKSKTTQKKILEFMENNLKVNEKVKKEEITE